MRLIDNPASDREADGKRQDRKHPPDAQSQRFEPVRVLIEQQGLAQGDGDAARKTEENPGGKKEPQAAAIMKSVCAQVKKLGLMPPRSPAA